MFTVYGIETAKEFGHFVAYAVKSLQQHLPFTVLKLAFFYKWIEIFMTDVATVPIVYSMLQSLLVI